jgi:hypothetical protein
MHLLAKLEKRKCKQRDYDQVLKKRVLVFESNRQLNNAIFCCLLARSAMMPTARELANARGIVMEYAELLIEDWLRAKGLLRSAAAVARERKEQGLSEPNVQVWHKVNDRLDMKVRFRSASFCQYAAFAAH